MNVKFLLGVLIITTCTCCVAQEKAQPQFSRLIIDSSIPGKFQKGNKQARDFTALGVGQANWYFTDNTSFGEMFPPQQSEIFLDTVQTFLEVPCDCMIKSDTIFLRGGLAYEAAMGFEVKIVKNLFSAETFLGGSFRIGNEGPYLNQISLKSGKQSLRISDQNSLRKGQTMIGQLTMESVEYQKKGDSTSMKMFMKVLFKCPINDVFVM
ncbi:MAG: hypothetical protein EOO88_01295 [Pedobacter sp.]|nr:MAG: hypothetical protein EOO88_01295 [Pedobacter sp.]